MRYSSKTSVEYDLKLHYQLHDKYQRELAQRSDYKGCRLKPTGTDKPYKFYSIKKPESKKFIYAGNSSNPDVRGIREYCFFEQALKVIESNICAMEEFLNVYRITNAENINELLGRTYRLPRNELLFSAEPEVDKWLKLNLAEKKKYPIFDPAGLKVTAFDGSPMRSRAEAAHYEAFYIYNVPVIFELPYKIGNEVYRPDFTSLYVYTMKTSMWEHLGNWYHSNLHKRQQYRDESVFRWDEYAKIGFFPETNLILTFGSSENNFDIQAIHRKIAAFSMPPPSYETIEILKRY